MEPTIVEPDEQVYFDQQRRSLRQKINADEFRKGWENGPMTLMGRAIDYGPELSTNR